MKHGTCYNDDNNDNEEMLEIVKMLNVFINVRMINDEYTN